MSTSSTQKRPRYRAAVVIGTAHPQPVPFDQYDYPNDMSSRELDTIQFTGCDFRLDHGPARRAPVP